ncbi:MAG: nucleoside-diphosphate sugar epimerase/dehydratase, partial [bacterium]
MHKLEGGIGLIDLVLKAFITIISISFILTIYYLSFPYHILSNGLYLYVMLLTLFSIIGWRVLFKWSIYKLDLTEKVVVLGSGSMARIVVHELLKKDNSSYKLEGLIDNSPKHIGKKIMGQEIIGLQNNLLSLVNDRKINKIVVALNQRRGMLPITELL